MLQSRVGKFFWQPVEKPFFCGKKTVLAKILFASKNTFLPLKIARQDRHSSEYDSDNSGHSSDSNTDVDY